MGANDTNGNHRGMIVNTASVAVIDGQMGQAANFASEGAMVETTPPTARDLAPIALR